MPDAADHPIAYTALQPGTPVQTSDGHHFATVQAVLVDEKVAVFDGIVVETAQGTRFVDADQIGSIYNSYVRTTLSVEQAANLPLPWLDIGRHQAGEVDRRPIGPHLRSAGRAEHWVTPVRLAGHRPFIRQRGEPHHVAALALPNAV